MQDGEEIRSQDAYCDKCAEWTDTDQVVFFFFFAIIAHHLRSAAVSRRSHLRSPLLLHFAHCKSKTHHPTTPYIDSGTIGIKSRSRRTTKTSGELYLFLIFLLLLLRCVVGSSVIFR
jgi:hypothetical protein